MVLLLLGVEFCTMALWPDAGVIEPRGESLMIKGTLKALVATTLCLVEEWVGKILEEETFPKAWFFFSTIVVRKDKVFGKKVEEKL